MTLQSSGSMTIADINTELGRSASAQLSTDDAELLGMADLNSSDSISIPDDLYGKTAIGKLFGTFNITVAQGGSGLYGYQSSSTGTSYGSIDIATYRGANIRWFYSRSSLGTTFDIVLDGTYSLDFITGVRFVSDGGLEFFPTQLSSYALGGSTGFGFYDGVPLSFIWDAGDVGLIKQVEIYGAP